MLINILEQNNNEIIFSIELPNSRAKRYIKQIIKKFDFDLGQDLIEIGLETEFMDEWLEEASRRLNCKFIPDFYRIKNFKAEGKGHPISFECIAFIEKALEKEHYRDFELELKVPEFDKDEDLDMRIQDSLYKLTEYHPCDEMIKAPNKIKAEITVFDKDTGKEIEEFSETFHNFLESGSLPEPVFKEFNGHKTGDSFEVEFKVDDLHEDWFIEDFADYKQILYKITVQEVYKNIYPEPPYTDEMAQKAGYKNINEIITEAQKRQNFYEKNIYKRELKKQYLKKVAENMGFEITENMISTKRYQDEITDKNDQFVRDTIFNAESYAIKNILEDILVSRIFATEGLIMKKESLENIIFERSGEDSMPQYEFQEKMTRLHDEKCHEWLELNLEKLISVKPQKVNDEALLNSIF